MAEEVQISEEHISMLMRGERPPEMDYEEFKLKRKALQWFLKRRRVKGVINEIEEDEQKNIRNTNED